uniref:Uncharacterized protein n=1 Tax=viral metagenome TaxID=1070528 RepID=A0A6C0HP85_9ZZZZ
MGNFNLYSKTAETEEPVALDQSFSSRVNDIAIHYILKQNVIDLLRLTDKEYSDNLIVLVSSVFDKNLTHEEIGLLNSHIESETIQEAILDLIPSNETAKKKMLMNIAKYYIKIMMIYSAIVSTLDPQYMYEDENGEKQVFYLKDFQQLKKIPKGVSPVLQQLTNPMNLCKRRVNILKNKLDDTEDDFYILNPGEKVCASQGTRTLNDEVGIKELDLLYYDVFDYGQKSWKTRSPEMDLKYNNDLTLFYQTFTGEQVRPSRVKSFKDIELLDFRSLSYCTDPLFTQEFTVSKSNPYIKRYVEEIKLIEEETKIYRESLNEQLNVLFQMNTKNEETYSINPMLTMKTILETEEKTRELISALYTDCERRFVNALILFEKIYDEQTKDLNQQQYTQLQKENVINAPRNQIALEDEVELEEEPLYNSALYVNKPLPLPENYKEPEMTEEKEVEPYDTIYGQENRAQENRTQENRTQEEQKDNLLDTGLDKPLNTVNPEEKDKSWISGITDTFRGFSAPSFMAKEDKPVPQKDTFGLETDFGKTQPVETEKDTFGITKPVPVEKDMFGVAKTVEPAVPVEKDMFGFAKTVEPVEPVEKDMFGFPKKVEPVEPVVNTNKNKNTNTNTNIVLKPLNLPRVENPSLPYNSQNMNRREPLPLPVPLPAPLPVDNSLKKNTIQNKPLANQAPNQLGARNTDARNTETRNIETRNRDERYEKKPEKKEENRRNVARNMFGEPDLS